MCEISINLHPYDILDGVMPVHSSQLYSDLELVFQFPKGCSLLSWQTLQPYIDLTAVMIHMHNNSINNNT